MACYVLSFDGIADKIRIPSSSETLNFDGLLLDLYRLKQKEDVTTTSETQTSKTPVKTLTIVPLENVASKAFSVGGVNTLRVKGTNRHFGNPFSHRNYPGVVKVFSTVKEAVRAYELWLNGEEYLDVDPERRLWILEQIKSGNLFGKQLIYYTETVPDNSYGLNKYDYEKAPNHAHILLKLINENYLQEYDILHHELQEDSKNISDYIFYSGGAKGADTLWAKTANKFGFKVIEYTPYDYIHMGSVELLKLESIFLSVREELGRSDSEDPFIRALTRRDMLLVKDADLVIAIAEILDNKVHGGTAYAIQRAIQLGLPIYVFDLQKEGWVNYNYDKKIFEQGNLPNLTQHSALIGTRLLHGLDNIVLAEMDAIFGKLTYEENSEIVESATISDVLNKIKNYTNIAQTSLKDGSEILLLSIDKIEALNLLQGKLSNLGVQMRLVDSRWLSNNGLPTNTEAVVVNGEIVVNTDIANIMSPLHEMMHLVFGVMRTDNFKKYFKLLNSFLAIPEFNIILEQVKQSSYYSSMMESDLLEEAFVRYLSGVIDGTVPTSEEWDSVFDLNKDVLNDYTSQTFGVPKIINLIGFLKSPFKELTGYSSELFIPKSPDTNGFSDQKYKVDIAGKITNFIQDLIKSDIILEGECK